MKRRGIVVLVIGLGLAALAGPVAIAFGAQRGEAAFGDSETFGLNRVTSANVSIEVGANTVPIETATLAPGDRLFGQIVFENQGSLPLRYSLAADTSSTGTVSLLDVLRWKIWPSSAIGACSSSFAAGRMLYDGVVDRANVLGDSAVGDDPGDRLVAIGSADVLCIEVELPIGVSDEYQAVGATVELIALAEQATDDLG